MSAILEPAKQFFEACETGQGWDACKAFCNSDATFSAQADALSELSTLEGYCECKAGYSYEEISGKYHYRKI